MLYLGQIKIKLYRPNVIVARGLSTMMIYTANALLEGKLKYLHRTDKIWLPVCRPTGPANNRRFVNVP